MTRAVFPSTISTQSPSIEFLTIKTTVRKNHQNNGHTGSSCLYKPMLGQRGGGPMMHQQYVKNSFLPEMLWDHVLAIRT